LDIKKYFEGIKKYTESISYMRYPHQNRYTALLHLLCDSVSKMTRKRMEGEARIAVCENGCDACCYFSDIITSQTEFDEIKYYINSKMESDIQTKLDQQWSSREDKDYLDDQPCPFLIMEQGSCSIYPVRPMGCRLLLSSRKCSRKDQNSGAFDSCQKWTRLGWQEMPLRPDTLLRALENDRMGRKTFELGKLFEKEKIDLKAFTPKELRGMIK
jgi:Fe-S-cluster containining protein